MREHKKHKTRNAAGNQHDLQRSCYVYTLQSYRLARTCARTAWTYPGSHCIDHQAALQEASKWQMISTTSYYVLACGYSLESGLLANSSYLWADMQTTPRSFARWRQYFDETTKKRRRRSLKVNQAIHYLVACPGNTPSFPNHPLNTCTLHCSVVGYKCCK